MHLSEREKITPGKWILRVACLNRECCQNLVSNTELIVDHYTMGV